MLLLLLLRQYVIQINIIAILFRNNCNLQPCFRIDKIQFILDIMRVQLEEILACKLSAREAWLKSLWEIEGNNLQCRDTFTRINTELDLLVYKDEFLRQRIEVMPNFLEVRVLCFA